MALIIGFAAIISTTLGGYLAIKLKDKLHLILGFSAGAVLGVALFDLIPEAINLSQKSYDISISTLLIAVGFAAFMVFDRFFSIHVHDESECKSGEECENEGHQGHLGAMALSIHSFLDGIGIGLAFKVSPAIGIVVATAVLAHDFSDGINTVNMILKNKGGVKKATNWLIADAVAPFFGVVATLFVTVNEATLGLILSVFAGIFLYIGASDLIPESHHHHPTMWTTFMTVLGLIVIYLAVHFAG